MRRSKRKGKTALTNVVTKPEGDVLNEAYLASVELYVQNNQQGDPTTYKQATQGADSEKWNDAMADEIKSLEGMGTWKAVPLPKGRTPISCK